MSEVRYTGGIDTGCFYGNKEDPGVSACCARPGGFQEHPLQCCCTVPRCPQPGSLLQGAPAASRWDFFGATTHRDAQACADGCSPLGCLSRFLEGEGAVFWVSSALLFGLRSHKYPACLLRVSILCGFPVLQNFGVCYCV